MKMKLFCMAAAMALLAGCTMPNYYNLQSRAPLAGPLSSEAAAYVALPPDGQFRDKTIFDSGAKAASIVGSVCRQHFKSVTIGDQVRDPDGNRQAAADKHCAYLFDTKIVAWEDHNTPWTGITDCVKIELTTINVANGAVLNVGDIWVEQSFMTVKDSRPEEFLGTGVDQYVKFLLGGPLPKAYPINMSAGKRY